MAIDSFFAAVPDTPRDDLLDDYLKLLESRNGTLATSGGFPARDAWVAEADADPVRHAGELDSAAFQRGFASAGVDKSADKVMLAVLAFMKMNAGEAYGVEVVAKARHKREASNSFERLERILGNEETYHTRILLGAAHQFGLEPPTAAYRPPVPLRILIGTLAHAPQAAFHPVLLASEVGGVYTFNWMLNQVGRLFADEPDLRESLEARLVEILVDEVGHVAFNRLAVGPAGMKAARAMAPGVVAQNPMITPPLAALGWDAETTKAFGRFDYSALPEEVRRRGFFV